jgi:hypothetical protein
MSLHGSLSLEREKRAWPANQWLVFSFKDHYFWENSSSTPRPFPFFYSSSLTASGLSVLLVRVDEHVNVISRLKSVRQVAFFSIAFFAWFDLYFFALCRRERKR